MTPTEREWVYLTDEEIKEIIGPWGDTPIKGYTRQLFDKIEAKIREKNAPLRAALNQSPVKTYCGGKPNYVIPESFNEWWNSDWEPEGNPFEEDTPAYWAYEGWMARGR